MLLNLLFWVICAYLIAHTLSAETSSFMFSLRYCKDMANLLYWVLGHAWLCTPKKIDTYQLVENFCVWQAKMNFVPHVFPDIYIYLYIYIYIYMNFLYQVLWVCKATKTQNDSINLKKTSLSICMQKNKLHHSLLPLDIAF